MSNFIYQPESIKKMFRHHPQFIWPQAELNVGLCGASNNKILATHTKQNKTQQVLTPDLFSAPFPLIQCR